MMSGVNPPVGPQQPAPMSRDEQTSKKASSKPWTDYTCGTIEKVKSYMSREAIGRCCQDHQYEIIFAINCTITAILSPKLFFVTTLMGIAARIVFAQGKRAVQDYIPKICMPYFNMLALNERSRVISLPEVGGSIVGAVASVLTIGHGTSATLALRFCPMFGGLAFGSALYNIFHKVMSTSKSTSEAL